MRTTRSLLVLPLLVGTLSLGTGCFASQPSAPIQTYGDGGTNPGPGPTQPKGDMALPDDGEVDPPVLGTIAQVTEYDTVPVNGIAEPGATVLVRSSDGKTVSTDVSSTGRFCVDVPLALDRTSTFDLTAVDVNGNESTSVSLSVRQEGTPEQAPPPATPMNAALGGVAKSSLLGVFTQPDDALLIDDSTASGFNATWSDPWEWTARDPNAYVKLRIPSRINTIKIFAPGDCLFNKPMDLYYSTLDNPGAPHVADVGAWKKVPTSVSDDKMTATATMSSTTATHIAVVFKGEGFGNCGLGYAEYGIAEMQAWTVPNVAPPPPRAPSCAGGAL